MYKYLLFDADDTILDFKRAEEIFLDEFKHENLEVVKREELNNKLDMNFDIYKYNVKDVFEEIQSKLGEKHE